MWANVQKKKKDFLCFLPLCFQMGSKALANEFCVNKSQEEFERLNIVLFETREELSPQVFWAAGDQSGLGGGVEATLMTGDITWRAATKVPPQTVILCPVGHSGTGQVRGDAAAQRQDRFGLLQQAKTVCTVAFFFSNWSRL